MLCLQEFFGEKEIWQKANDTWATYFGPNGQSSRWPWGKFYPHKPAPLIIISQNKHSCCCWSYQGGMLSMCEVSEYWVVSPETKSSRSYDRLTTKCGNCTESACTEVTYCTASTCTQRWLIAQSLVVHRGYLLTTFQWVLVALRLLHVYRG